MPKKSVPPLLRKLVADRALGCCEYCMSQEFFSTSGFTIDHINPDGGDDLENLALACHRCNGSKFTKTVAVDPESGELVAVFNPRNNAWIDHFRWNDDFTKVIGITPTGRATVKRLHINRAYLQNQRALYRIVGIHPPAHSIA
jgi:HNH endonuclease